MLHQDALPGLATLAVSCGAHVRLSAAEFLFTRAACAAGPIYQQSLPLTSFRRTPPPGPGLCAPVLWLINLSIWPHDLGRHIREKLLKAV